jgi:hypothetical protein
MFTNLNFWAILVSGLVYWILGGIWYAAVFSKSWQEALGFNSGFYLIAFAVIGGILTVWR